MKAVIFDFDGLLVDSEPWQFKGLKSALADFGFTLTKEKFIKQWVEEGFDFEGAVRKYNLSCSSEDIRKKKRQYYSELSKKILLREGALALLKKLKQDFKLALATNSFGEEVIPIIERLNVNDYFDVLITREDYDNPKPAPDCLLAAARKLHLKPEDCIVLEDTRRGIKTAKNAGMKVIVVPNDFSKHNDFSRADLMLDSLNDMTIETTGGL
jgi:putative hydrolase of the HAD superfamily